MAVYDLRAIDDLCSQLFTTKDENVRQHVRTTILKDLGLFINFRHAQSALGVVDDMVGPPANYVSIEDCINNCRNILVMTNCHYTKYLVVQNIKSIFVQNTAGVNPLLKKDIR